MELLKVISDLVTADGVTGNERAVGDIIKGYFFHYTDDVWQDKMGNVYGRMGSGNKPVILVVAHMDEVGMMVTKIEENGMLRITQVGGVDPRVLPAAEVFVLGKKLLKGVIGAVPPHLLEGEQQAYKMEELVCDIGYPPEQVKALVSVGDFVTFAPKPPVALRNDFVASKTLDDRALVAAMFACMEMLQKVKLECTVVFCASVQEERGGIGAKAGAYSVNPDIAVAIDVTHGPTPGTKPFETYDMGKVALTKGGNIHPRVFELLRQSAKEQNIETEIEVCMGRTGTDAWEMQVERGGIPTAIVSPPLRYMHTSVETIRLNTLQNCAKVIAGLAAGINSDWEEALCLQD